MKGLKANVKDALVTIVDRPKTLEGWEPLVISIDSNIHQRELERRNESKIPSTKKSDPFSNSAKPVSTSTPSNSTISTSAPNDIIPMDIDAVHTANPTPSIPRAPLTPT
ncbi:hypothetical protein C0993_005060 [Termitomyces sp. T159_Od127]|nr:hypothetical protein C0993_005060 [Termitomyces sp. T159_Od127]